jgi:hypothetical protein
LQNRDLKFNIIKASKPDIAKELNIEIGDNFDITFKKCYYKYPYKRDSHLIKYLVNYCF